MKKNILVLSHVGPLHPIWEVVALMINPKRLLDEVSILPQNKDMSLDVG